MARRRNRKTNMTDKTDENQESVEATEETKTTEENVAKEEKKEVSVSSLAAKRSEKRRKEQEKAMAKKLVKKLDKTGVANFYKLAVKKGTNELLGVVAFSKPHQESHVLDEMKKATKQDVELKLPAALRLDSEDVAMITSLLRNLGDKEFDRKAFDNAMGKSNSSSEISVARQ